MAYPIIEVDESFFKEVWERQYTNESFEKFIDCIKKNKALFEKECRLIINL